jgi:hypothetical protein
LICGYESACVCIAIGSAIASSVHQAHALAAGLSKVAQSHGVLQAMKSEYAWFMPMLEVAMAHKAAERRGSVVMNRLRSSISPVASSDAALHADAAEEESGFSSVVRLGAHGPRLAVCPLASDALMPCGPRLAFLALPANSKGTPPQVPADALASEVVDSTLAEPVAAAAALGSAPHASGDVGSESEVPDFAQWWHAAMRFAIRHFADLCTVQAPAAASGSARDLPPHASATRPEHELPSYAGLDTTESIPVHSNQHDEASVASSLVRVRSRRGVLTISVAAAEP